MSADRHCDVVIVGVRAAGAATALLLARLGHDAYRDAELLAVALDRTIRGEADEATALSTYEHQRDEALRDIFDITCAMASYPAVEEFVELQRHLAHAIDVEAADAAARPIPGQRAFAAR